MSTDPLPVVVACYRVATLADGSDRPDLGVMYRAIADALTDHPKWTATQLAAHLLTEIGVTA